MRPRSQDRALPLATAVDNCVSRPRGSLPRERFSPLALFGRRSPERVVRSSLPASENLHRSGSEQVQQRAWLFDYLVGKREQLRWHFQTECLSGLEIDN